MSLNKKYKECIYIDKLIPRKKIISKTPIVKETQEEVINTEADIRIKALSAKIFLKIKNREGKNSLMENYIKRVSSIIGASK